MGKVAAAIFRVHKDCDTLYEFNDEAEDAFEQIVDMYNATFNYKYSRKLHQKNQKIIKKLFS